jgi:hypothetical protein
MTNEQIAVAISEMIEMFGDKLPDPEHCPKEFQYYIKLYLYEKKVNESSNKPI